MKNAIKTYLSRPSINKKGFCESAGTTTQEVGRIISGKQNMTPQMKTKICVQLESEIEAAQNLLSHLQKG